MQALITSTMNALWALPDSEPYDEEAALLSEPVNMEEAWNQVIWSPPPEASTEEQG